MPLFESASVRKGILDFLVAMAYKRSDAATLALVEAKRCGALAKRFQAKHNDAWLSLWKARMAQDLEDPKAGAREAHRWIKKPKVVAPMDLTTVRTDDPMEE